MHLIKFTALISRIREVPGRKRSTLNQQLKLVFQKGT